MNKISKKYSNGFSWLVVMVTFIVKSRHAEILVNLAIDTLPNSRIHLRRDEFKECDVIYKDYK